MLDFHSFSISENRNRFVVKIIVREMTSESFGPLQMIDHDSEMWHEACPPGHFAHEQYRRIVDLVERKQDFLKGNIVALSSLDNAISTEELASSTGRDKRWLQSKAPELIEKGLARRIGRPVIWEEAAIEHFLTMPETRGAKKKK